MRQYVKKYIKTCVECAYQKVESGRKEAELHKFPRVPIPFHVVYMDHLGPFPDSTAKNIYTLAAIDHFTEYVILKAVKDVTTKPACNMLSIFGAPVCLVTDQ